MKKVIISLVLLILTTGLFFTSCKKPGCTDNTASNFNKESNKDDGTCIYYGDLYTGSYSMTVQETHLSGIQTKNYILVITKETNNGIKISNLAAIGGIVFGDVNSSGLQIATQYWGASIGGQVSGSGSINGSTLTIDYTYDGSTVTGHGTGIKQ